jgi:hypothetical protein
MAKFTVSLLTHASEDVTVEAATPHDAIKTALEAVGDGGVQRLPLRWKADSLEGEDGALYVVVGACESCGLALMEDEEAERIGPLWSTDEEGIQFHNECPPATPKAGA